MPIQALELNLKDTDTYLSKDKWRRYRRVVEWSHIELWSFAPEEFPDRLLAIKRLLLIESHTTHTVGHHLK